MTDREQLIELILNVKSDDFRGVSVEQMADYLLYNGVIVPPVKVGDAVYVISRNNIVPLKIDTIQYNSYGCNILGRNEKYFGNGTITLHPNNKFGIEWYLTREEAEKALKEREENA